MTRSLSILGLVLCAAVCPAQTAADLFDDSSLHEIRLFVHPVDWSTLKENYLENTHYPADLEWRGLVVHDISIRSRGFGSRSGDKPGLQLEFGRYIKGQRFLGLERLVLDNVYQDVTLLRERLSMALFRRMGIAAPREAHARVLVNGEYAGLFVVVEDLDRVFLETHFNDPDGFLYEYRWSEAYYFGDLGTDLGRYLDKFKPVTHEDAPQAESIEELTKLINETSGSDFLTRVSERLDLRQLATVLAIECFIAEWDGFLGTEGMNNFYLYRPAFSRQFRIIPWDKDVTFIFPDHPLDFRLTTNILVSKLMAHPEFVSLYYQELQRAADTAGGEGGWLARQADAAFLQIRDAAHADRFRPGSDEDFEYGVEFLKDFIKYRAETVYSGLQR